MSTRRDPNLEPPYVINPAVAHREIEGQVLLLLPDDYEMLTLNETGRMVWIDLVAGRPLSTTAQALAERYAIPLERALHDVRLLVGDLVAKGVLLPSDEPAGGA